MNATDPVKVGDPDVTDHQLPDELLCPAVWDLGEHQLVMCTRVAGHDNPHIAGNGTEVLAVWP